MQKYNIEAYPNQSFFVVADGVEYTFELQLFRGITYVNISIDGNRIVSGAKAIQNTPLIPKGLVAGGNFYFASELEDYPDSDVFGKDVELVYISNEEMEDMTGSEG